MFELFNIKLSAPYFSHVSSFSFDDATAVTLQLKAFEISMAESPIPPEAPIFLISASLIYFYDGYDNNDNRTLLNTKNKSIALNQ